MKLITRARKGTAMTTSGRHLERGSSVQELRTEVFMEIFNQVFAEHVDRRISYFPTDPAYINNDIRESEEYKEEIADTKRKLLKISEELKDSVPFFSPRYQAHMCWDVTMPSLLGYMIGLLNNQNNVDTAASSVTTVYEKTIGLQMCDMLGYNVESSGEVKGWGHITCGGSVANIESLWAARNIKFSALAVQNAVREAKGDVLSAVQKEASLKYNVKVAVAKACCDSEGEFYEWIGVTLGDCTTRQLLNMDVDEYCNLTSRVAEAAGLEGTAVDEFGAWVEKCSITSLGVQNFMQLHDIKSPVYTVPANCHYSWPKGGNLIGVGSDALVAIPLDDDFRQDVEVLKSKLEEAITKDQPILSVVAVIGSTEESAVDPISRIWHLRNTLKTKHGVNFVIHADAAWGGYFRTMLHDKPVKERISNKSGFMPFTPLTKYVTEQYENLPKADTITLDPHKSGFCPYPAGALCYRNEAMRYTIALMHPEVYHGADDPTMGVYGIEGSKPGAAPTAVLASHQVIGLDVYGYGRILGQCTTTCKLFYCLWLTLARPDDPFICVPLQKLPEKFRKEDEHGVSLGERIIREKILGKPMSVIYQDEEVRELLNECGPDTIINTFVINMKNPDGTINSSVEKSNDLQKALSDDLNVMVGSNAQRVPFIIMQSGLNQAHGQALMTFKKRIGLEDATDLNVLVNTTMNPWQWNESIQAVGEIFRNNILNSLGKITDLPGHHEFILCGDPDENQNVFAEYIPSFASPSRCYQIVAKFKLSSYASQQCSKGMYVRSMCPMELHQFLCTTNKDGAEFMLCEKYGADAVSQVNLVVEDVPYYQHFDMSKHAAYKEKQTYFLYGDKERTYLTHSIKKHPDFMQIIELDATPFGLPDCLKEVGLEVTIPELCGQPKMVSSLMADPLDNSSYTIAYRGREHAKCTSTAYFQKGSSKLLFNEVQ